MHPAFLCAYGQIDFTAAEGKKAPRLTREHDCGQGEIPAAGCWYAHADSSTFSPLVIFRMIGHLLGKTERASERELWETQTRRRASCRSRNAEAIESPEETKETCRAPPTGEQWADLWKSRGGFQREPVSTNDMISFFFFFLSLLVEFVWVNLCLHNPLNTCRQLILFAVDGRWAKVNQMWTTENSNTNYTIIIIL